MLKKIKNPLNKLSGKIAMKKKKCDSYKEPHAKYSYIFLHKKQRVMYMVLFILIPNNRSFRISIVRIKY